MDKEPITNLIMRKMNIISRFALLLIVITVMGCAGPWKGKILDIETKEPLEGAVVLAVWQRVYRTPTGASSYFYEAKETVTNKAGEFEIPSYTPINLLPLISFMRGPEFTIFKPGYGVMLLTDGKHLTRGASESVDVGIDGKNYHLPPGLIELPRLLTREGRIRNKPAPVGERRDWVKQREFIRAIREEWKSLYNEDPKDLYEIEVK